MRSDRTVIALAWGVAAAALALAGATMGRINALRTELELTITVDLAGLPPSVALAHVAMGSFRGLATDVLWSRAHDLEQAGRYHEAMQSAEWISKLQPHFPRVWAFRAFHMAYNISVATHTPEERWMWVNAGIKLLRDEAIPLNPKSLVLPLELSRIYLDKIGDGFDDMHLHYKQVIARDWHELLGPPPEGDREAFARWLEPLVDVPLTTSELLATHPDAVHELSRLQAAGYALDRKFLRHLLDADALGELARLGLAIPPDLAAKLAPLTAWRTSPTGADTRARLVSFTRAKLVRAQNLDPARMVALTRRDGPLDWRDPGSHGLYWADVGRQVLETRPTSAAREEHEFWNIYRLMLKAGKHLQKRGTIVFDLTTGYYRQLPSPHFYALYERVIGEAIAAIPADKPIVVKSFRDSFKAHRLEAIWLSWYYGEHRVAQSIADGLRVEYPDEFNLPLDELIDRINFGEFVDVDMTPEEAREAIGGLLKQAIETGLAVGKTAVFERFVGQARRIRDTMFRIARAGQLDPAELPPIVVQLSDAYLRYLWGALEVVRSAHPEVEVGSRLLVRSRSWRAAPVELRREVYDRMFPRLAPVVESIGQDPRAMFPEPPGMDEHRALRRPR